MRAKRQKRKLLIFALSLSAATPVFAAGQPGWFYGISLSRPDMQFEIPGIVFSGREDTSYRISAGYKFTPSWKAELNFLGISKPSLTSNLLYGAGTPEGNGRGLQLVGTGTLPVTEKFGLYGKLGALHSSLESSCATNILTCAAADRSTDLSYGVGLRYDFTKTVSVSGEWQRFRHFGGRDIVTGDLDKDFFSVGMGFKF
jgi:OOP family OmpA-OmpF porin